MKGGYSIVENPPESSLRQWNELVCVPVGIPRNISHLTLPGHGMSPKLYETAVNEWSFTGSASTRSMKNASLTGAGSKRENVSSVSRQSASERW